MEFIVDGEKKIIQSFNCKVEKYKEKLAHYLKTNK